MDILFIGGTRFVGRAMAEVAARRGHAVTVLHRGRNTPETLTSVEHLTADRDGDLSVLDGRSFDATVDVCAYVPRQVDSLARALDGRGGHHVFISTMSVYADTDEPGLTESGALVRLDDPTTEEVTEETYGGLKVLCEEAAQAAYGDGLTIIRPTYVVGPHDPTGRFTWWVRRIARGGDVVAPGPADSPIQLVDARDQAEWAIDLVEGRVTGIYNGVGSEPPFGFGDMLEATVAAVGPPGTQLVWMDGDWLKQQGETYQTLPLWVEGGVEWLMASDPSAAFATGLRPRPLVETVADTLTWIQSEQPPEVEGWGISAEHEAELLTAWRTSRS
ncbi:MAG: NAD-dependent epimerase/dehydratase family protein [Nocardioidaceae bacterium]